MRNLTHASTTSLKSVPVLALTIWYGMIAKVNATGTATQKGCWLCEFSTTTSQSIPFVPFLKAHRVREVVRMWKRRYEFQGECNGLAKKGNAYCHSRSKHGFLERGSPEQGRVAGGRFAGKKEIRR